VVNSLVSPFLLPKARSQRFEFNNMYRELKSTLPQCFKCNWSERDRRMQDEARTAM
jgi:hypothetical protein